MIKAGADVNAANEYGETPMMLATGLRFSRGFLRESNFARPYFLQILIENSADVNAANMNGMTPLMYAAQIALPNNYRYKRGIIQMLIDNGADIAIKDNIGRTALNYAKGKRVIIARVMTNGRVKDVFEGASERTAIYELLGENTLSTAEPAVEYGVGAMMNIILISVLLWQGYRIIIHYINRSGENRRY
jgi:predicted transcriptional regulator